MKQIIDAELLLSTLNKRLEIAINTAKGAMAGGDADMWVMRIQVLREMIALVSALSREVTQ